MVFIAEDSSACLTTPHRTRGLEEAPNVSSVSLFRATALFTMQASRLASLATRRLEEGQIVGVYWQKAL